MIFQKRPDGAGDHVAVDGGGQVGLDGILMIDAGVTGLVFDLAGEGNGEVQTFHRIGKAGQQRQLQHQMSLAVFVYHIFHRVGQGILKTHGKRADEVTQRTAQIHLCGVGGFGGVGHGAVLFDILGIPGQRERKAAHRFVQADGDGDGHLTLAVGCDGGIAGSIDSGGFGISRNGAGKQQQAAKDQTDKTAAHPKTSFLTE